MAGIQPSGDLNLPNHGQEKLQEEPRHSLVPSQASALSIARNNKNKWRRLSRAVIDHNISEDDLHGLREQFCEVVRSTVSRNSFSFQNADFKSKIRQRTLENTYQLEPKNLPKLGQVYQIISKIVGNGIRGESYDHACLGELSKGICNEVRRQIKEQKLLPDRYKMVVLCQIGQVQNYDFRFMVGRLMNKKFDRSVEFSRTEKEIWCSCSVQIVYFE